MSPTADWPASKPKRPGTTPSSTTPHIPSTTARALAEQDVAVARAHDRSPSSRARSPSPPGAETCASTFATATAVPGRRPVHAAACSLRPPARAPSGTIVPRHLLVDDVLEARVERGEVARRREAVALRPHRLVAGGAARCASRRRSAARRPSRPPRSAGRRARRPRAPRRGSAAPSRRTTRTRSCRRSAASHGSPRSAATALIRSASGCAAWCFQSFTHACGSARRSSSRQSGVPSASVGSIVQAVKSMPTPITSAGSTPVSASSAGTVSWNVRR